MIHLVTGVPGAGKTLYAISYIKDLAEKSGRTVYYNGIPELTLPWVEFDTPEKWYELPSGSIIVIDECQRHFRPRHASKEVPAHVEQLETHRHKGFDIFFITQSPQLIDMNVRRLVGRHFHATRRWGWKKSTIFDFESCKDNPTTANNIASGQRIDFVFPKSLYGVYKSAEVHTHKARIPFKIVFIVLAPFVIIGLLWLGIHRMMPKDEKTKQGNSPSASMPVARAVPGQKQDNKTLTKDEWLNQQIPRVPGLAYTAAHYDEVTKPVRAPFPAACMSMGKKCKCYTKQGTVLDMPADLCENIVKKGFFKDFDEERASRNDVVLNRPEDHKPTMSATETRSRDTGANIVALDAKAPESLVPSKTQDSPNFPIVHIKKSGSS